MAMKQMCLVFFFAMPLIASAQFNKSDIDDLKADLLNYAESGCSNQQYLRSATNLMGKLSSPISSSITSEQAKANNQLRNALSGIREGVMAATLGNKASCPQKIRDGVKKLDTLPIKSQPGSNFPKQPDGGVTR